MRRSSDFDSEIRRLLYLPLFKEIIEQFRNLWQSDNYTEIADHINDNTNGAKVITYNHRVALVDHLGGLKESAGNFLNSSSMPIPELTGVYKKAGRLCEEVKVEYECRYENAKTREIFVFEVVGGKFASLKAFRVASLNVTRSRKQPSASNSSKSQLGPKPPDHDFQLPLAGPP